MSFYEEMQGVASDILKEFKQGVIRYSITANGSGPADKPSAGVETVLTLDGTARGVKSKYVNNGLAVATDYQVTASVKALTSANVEVEFSPEQKGFIIVDDVRYKIIKVIKRPSAGTPVAFTLIIRK